MRKDNIISALDIGSSKITCLITSLSANEEKKVNVVGVATTPSRGIRKGQVVDIEEAVGSITDCVEAAERMAGFNIDQALVSVSGEHLESLNSNGVVAVNEPEGEITSDDIFRVIEAARAVSMPSSREILHILPREFVVDSQKGIKDPLGMTGVRLECEAHLITASSTANRNIKKCVSDLSIKPHPLVFSGLASSYSTLTDTEKELGVILVDIGGGTTSISIFVEGACSYSAVIPVGAKNITNDLAIGLRISLDSAEKIKQYLSQPQAKRDNSDKKAKDEINLARLGLKEDVRSASRRTIIEGIIKPRLAEIYSLVGAVVKKAGFAGATPAGIVLTGGGALTVDSDIICKRTLQLPVRIALPKGLFGLTDEIDSPAYSTVVGLILYGLSQNKSHSGFFKLNSLVKSFPLKDSGDKIISWIKSFLP